MTPFRSIIEMIDTLPIVTECREYLRHDSINQIPTRSYSSCDIL